MASKDTQLDLFNKLINLAGRQRMLSQRIGFFLLKFRMSILQDTEITHYDSDCLRASLSQFEEVHNLLLAGHFEADGVLLHFCSIEQSQPASSLHAIEHFLHATTTIVAQVEVKCAINADQIDALIEEIPGSILSSLQAIVDCLQEECHERSQRETRNLSQSIEDARLAIKRIETAARYSRMVSLNARVAAGRAGSKGAEFSALSTELKTVADSIQEAADDVRDYLTEIA